MNDDVDSLFGSRPPSPFAAYGQGRSPAPTLALPGSSTTSTQNVGTIALPGLHVRSEQPRPLVLPTALNSSPRLRRTGKKPPRHVEESLLQPPPAPSAAAAKASLKRKRAPPASAPFKNLPMDMPEPGEPVPPNFLRNHSAVLGVVGQIARLRLPDPIVPGTSTADPIVVPDEPSSPPRRRTTQCQPTQRKSKPRSSPAPSLPASVGGNTAASALRQLEGNPQFIGILRALLAHATDKGGPPRPLKRRRQLNPPETPEPRQQSVAPSQRETVRSAKLVHDLVALLSDAVGKSTSGQQSLATPALSVAGSSASAAAAATPADQPLAISTSVQGWLDSLALASPVASSSDSFELPTPGDGGFDSLQSLMDKYEKESDEALFSALFGETHEPYFTEQTPVHTPGPLETQHASSDTWRAHTAASDVVQPPWPTPDPSEQQTMADEDESASKAPLDDMSMSLDDSSNPLAWPDAINFLLASLPPSTDTAQTPDAAAVATSSSVPFSEQPTPSAALSFSLDPALTDFDVSTLDASVLQQIFPPVNPDAPAVPPSTPQLLTPADFDMSMSPSGSMGVNPLALSLNPIPILPPPVFTQPMAVDASPSVQSAFLPPDRPSKVEKKSDLLARAAAHRARLSAELERVKQDIWGCTVEDGVLHHLRTMK